MLEEEPVSWSFWPSLTNYLMADACLTYFEQAANDSKKISKRTIISQNLYVNKGLIRGVTYLKLKKKK